MSKMITFYDILIFGVETCHFTIEIDVKSVFFNVFLSAFQETFHKKPVFWDILKNRGCFFMKTGLFKDFWPIFQVQKLFFHVFAFLLKIVFFVLFGHFWRSGNRPKVCKRRNGHFRILIFEIFNLFKNTLCAQLYRYRQGPVH